MNVLFILMFSPVRSGLSSPLSLLVQHFCGIMGDFYVVLLADVSAIKVGLMHSIGFLCFYDPGVDCEDPPHQRTFQPIGGEFTRFLIRYLFYKHLSSIKDHNITRTTTFI